jgi:uncharacterized protein HemX
MKTILVSITVAAAMAAGAAVYCFHSRERMATTAKQNARSQQETAQTTGVAAARELDRLKMAREIQGEIELNEQKMAAAEAIVNADEFYQSGQWQTWSGQDVTELNVARAQDARERLEYLRAQAASLAVR